MRFANSILVALLPLAIACSGKETGQTAEPPGPTTTDPTLPLDPLIQPDTPPSHLVMISVDTLRRDALGVYGAEGGAATTPKLNALFNDGLRLNAHHSCSNWTYPSVACVAGGRYNTDIGYIPPAGVAGEDLLPQPESANFLNDWLGDAGFTRATVMANFFLCSKFGFGEVEYEECSHELDAAEVTATALAVTDEHLLDAERVFLHLHYLDPHLGYNPPEGYRDEIDALPDIGFNLDSVSEVTRMESEWETLDAETQAAALHEMELRYAAEVRAVDDAIGALIDGLNDRGMLDDTLVVFWADHGEQLMDRGTYGHAEQLYLEEVGVMAGFWGAGVPAGTVWEGTTTHADIAPTILTALGLPLPPEITGAPIGTAPPQRTVFQVERRGESAAYVAASRGEHHLLYWWSGERALHDTDSDPLELTDIYDPTDPTVISMWEDLLPEVTRISDQIRSAPTSPGP